MSPLRELILLRLRTFLREPEALFWTFVFPILMAIGLGLAFREQPDEPAAVAVEAGPRAEEVLRRLGGDPEIEVKVMEPEEAARALRTGEVALVLRPGDEALVTRFDPTRPESRGARLLVDRALQAAAGAPRPVAVVERPERQPGSRCIDWVVPGLIGLNLMSTGMWGIGYGIVFMRQKRQLKRLIATPMRKSHFLLAQIAARMAFLVLEVTPIVLFARLVFGVEVRGSVLGLALVILLGAMTFAGLGLLASSRASTIEGVSGIMNVVMLPMFILSGVFFSASRFPDALQPLVQALPLTALNDAMRAVYNEGLPLWAAAGDLAILGAWTLGTFAAALWLFRWR